MRLDDRIRKCVVFIQGPKIGVETGTSVDRATGFIITMESNSSIAHHYLVTARHVAERCEQNGLVGIRLNRRDGQSAVVRFEPSKWVFHETDETIDVAVVPCPFDPSEYDCMPIPVDPMFLAGPRTLKSKGIGIGDNIYVVGLFSSIAGVERILPLVRSGTIAMIPEERVGTAWPKAQNVGIEAYLVEAFSIAGLSGAPVFVARTIPVPAAARSGRQPVAEGAHFLLGLLHGHWKVKLDQGEQASDFYRDQINFGLASVVPAERILETVNHPKLRAIRS